MKYHTTTGDKAVMLRPESVEECGLLLWLATRFAGMAVTLKFDTTLLNGNPNEPMFWIKNAIDKDAPATSDPHPEWQQMIDESKRQSGG